MRKMTPRTKAVILHHLYGLVARDYEASVHTCRTRGIKVIEDCAQATGAEHCGTKVGALGDAAFHSTEQSKVFTTVQGGIAVTDDDTIASRIGEYHRDAPVPDMMRVERLLHTLILNYYRFTHPHRWLLGDFHEVLRGKKRLLSTTAQEARGICPADYGQKMPPSIAAIGLNQLAKIDRFNGLRQKAAQRWHAWCDAGGYARPQVAANSVPVWLRYPVLVEAEKKKNARWARRSLGVELGVWFTTNLHP
ncbi:unnamed protein product, partial [marine sediment metagenome]